MKREKHCHGKMMIVLVLWWAGMVLWGVEPGSEKKTAGPVRVKHRLEVKYLMEYLEPHDVYDAWHSLYFHYYGFPSDTFNYFLHFGTVYREEKNDYIGIIGTARDWSARFYTYTAVAAGTECGYMPKFRIDHDFNFKIGKKKQWIWTLGGAYIKYHHDANDLIISSGLTLYLKKWVMEYRLFRNRSNPGEVVSLTHLVNIGYGAEKKNWTYFTFSQGSQAYLALFALTPEEVRQSAINLSVIHRRWLGKSFGFFLELDYVTLKDGYDKYGIFGGLFLEIH